METQSVSPYPKFYITKPLTLNYIDEKSKTSRITHLPDILVLALKRFSWDGRKDCTNVEFEETLNLDRLCSKSNKANADYTLSAVVLHGGRINSGHYFAVVKCDDGKWRNFNDRMVTVVSAREVFGSKKDFTPYLLFYQRSEKEVEKN